MKNPMFSVIIPTYEREKIIGRAIESVLNQTFTDFELIIVDDGSTDGTRSRIRSYSDERIRYIYKENGGQNSAINEGIKNSRGYYIAFCDSDDEWLPQKLEKVYEKYMSDETIDVVYHWTGIMSGAEVVLARKDRLEGRVYKEVLKQGYLTSPTFLTCKRKCFDIIGYLDLRVVNCQDDDMCFLLSKFFNIGLVKEILGVYYADVSNRKSNDRLIGVDSYVFLIKKHENDIVKYCGSRDAGRKYLSAAYRYMNLQEIEKAKQIYKVAEERGLSGLEKMKWKRLCGLMEKKTNSNSII